MLDFSACPVVSQDTAIDLIVCGYESILHAASESPWLWALVPTSAVITIIFVRSLLIASAVLILAVVAVDHIAAMNEPIERQFRFGAFAASFLLIWIGCIRFRRQIGREREKVASLQSEIEGLKSKLDREIVWRRAADPEAEDQVPTV